SHCIETASRRGLFTPRRAPGGPGLKREGAMKGAASRVSALAIAMCTVACSAFAQGVEVTDRDRVWRNFTREAAIIGEKHFWIEMRGMILTNDQSIKQTDSTGTQFEGPTLGLNGYPLNASPKCTISATKGCVERMTGGRFDLVGAYGLLSTLEVGFDFPF